MNLLNLDGVSKSYPEKQVLDGIVFGMDDGERVAVIGANGSGKSTLLRIIAGSLEPDHGAVTHTSGLRISMLDQRLEIPPEQTVADVIGHDREAVALADRFGLVDGNARIGALSGGQLKRVALAAALAAESELLILDEPTNHLDVDIIDWLEDHLSSRSGALLLVTHDRYLLDRVATRVVELHRGRVVSHRGTYEEFLEARATREAHEATVEHKRQQRIRIELEWLRRSPKARTSKAKHRIKTASKLMDGTRPEERPALDIELPSRRLGAKVVNLHNAGKRYGDRWVVRGVDLRLAGDARIGVVGPNGAGKTTLLSLIAGRITPDEGKVVAGTTAAIGWYGQEVEPIPAGERVIAAMKEIANETRLASGVTVGASQLLEQFLFPSTMHKALVGDLSGGERRRLELVRVLATAPNVLLLDEPTNDLDIDTLEAFEEYLDAWPGVVVAASHDRYFLDRVCRDIYSIEPDGAVRHHPGGWAAYRSGQLTVTAPSPTTASPTPRRPRPKRRTLTFNDAYKLDRLETRIPALESRREKLERDLAIAGDDYLAAARLGAELRETIEQLDTAEIQWLELTELAERLAEEGTGREL